MVKKLNILLIGSKSREHAIAWKLQNSPRLGKLYIAPGNGGTAMIAQNLDLDILNPGDILAACKKYQTDLVEISQDDVLATDVVDRLRKEKVMVFGPSQAAAKIEYSKAYAKDMMKRAGIHTADYMEFNNYEAAIKYVSKSKFPLVIKADGLALGKGVVIAQDKAEAKEALQSIMLDKKFGDSGAKVIIEEFLRGTEVSTHAFCDGKTYKMFPSSQDHKQIYDGDTGPNTGGMGTITPLSWVSQEQVDELGKQMIEPLLKELHKERAVYQGCLYPGLMLDENGYNIVEYNARFGDPEMQSYLRLLETDLIDILEACATGTLDQIDIKWSGEFACTVVIASGGYPGDYNKGEVITGIEEAEKNEEIKVFQDGTKIEGDTLLTNGGRVLSVTATGATLDKALAKAYAAVKKIHFKGMQYRTDIGRRVIPDWKI